MEEILYVVKDVEDVVNLNESELKVKVYAERKEAHKEAEGVDTEEKNELRHFSAIIAAVVADGPE